MCSIHINNIAYFSSVISLLVLEYGISFRTRSLSLLSPTFTVPTDSLRVLKSCTRTSIRGGKEEIFRKAKKKKSRALLEKVMTESSPGNVSILTS